LRASPSLATLTISGPAGPADRREPEKHNPRESLVSREFTRRYSRRREGGREGGGFIRYLAIYMRFYLPCPTRLSSPRCLITITRCFECDYCCCRRFNGYKKRCRYLGLTLLILKADRCKPAVSLNIKASGIMRNDRGKRSPPIDLFVVCSISDNELAA